MKIINGEVVQDEECDVDGASGARSESDVAEVAKSNFRCFWAI